jgi:hypothetical protein
MRTPDVIQGEIVGLQLKVGSILDPAKRAIIMNLCLQNELLLDIREQLKQKRPRGRPKKENGELA